MAIRLKQLGIDQLLADSANDFSNVYGGNAEQRAYIREWLSDAITRRDKTNRWLAAGRVAFRARVLRSVFQEVEGRTTQAIDLRYFAIEQGLDEDELRDAMEILVEDQLLARDSVGTYRLSIAGRKEIEAAQNIGEDHGAGSSVEQGSGVFVGHGNSLLYHQVITYLLDEFGIHAHTFERHKVGGQQVVPTLEKLLKESGFAIIVATAEDHTETGLRARQNVVHETGLFQGRLGFERVAVLLERGTEQYSNLGGILYISFEPGRIDQTFNDLGRMLRARGYKQA